MEPHHYQFLTSFITLTGGYAAKRLGVVSNDDVPGLSRLLYGLLVPALILSKMTVMPLNAEYLVLIPINAAHMALSILGAFLVFRNAPPENKGLLIVCSIGNSLPFGIPLIQAVWGIDGLLLAFIYDLPNVLCIFGTDMMIAESYAPVPAEEAPLSAPTIQLNPVGTTQEDNTTQQGQTPGVVAEEETAAPTVFDRIALVVWRVVLRNTVFDALILALVINLLPVPVPAYFLALTDSMGVAVTPVVLLVCGIAFEANITWEAASLTARILLLRFAVSMSHGMLVYFTCPLAPDLRSIIIMHNLCPVDNVVIRYAIIYGYSRKLAAQICNISMAFSFILLWAAATFTAQ